MIYYNFITIILFLIIFILILKFRDVKVDNFDTLDCSDPNEYSLECDTVKIFKDKRINDKILNILRKELQVINKDFNQKTNRQLNEFIKRSEETQKKIDDIIDKIRYIDESTKTKMKNYVKEKNTYNKNLLNYFDDIKQKNESQQYIYSKDDFKKKNELLRNRLALYYQSLKDKNPINNSIKCDDPENCSTKDILILKNKYNKNELNLREVKDEKKIKYFGFSSGNENRMYHLIVNNGCVKYSSRLEISIGNCNKESDLYFIVNEVKDANTYNKYIRYDNTSNETHEVEVDQYGVEYPFYIISPSKYPGICVSYNEDKLYFKPVRNDPHQRFNLANISNYCTY